MRCGGCGGAELRIRSVGFGGGRGGGAVDVCVGAARVVVGCGGADAEAAGCV